ncbi:hypothetical protein [Mycobacterium florentinum]|nr:hypothetical protein [Mycobacterium florentinum]MCV7408656.1 hypothetical protein [Mycobacterium florentinum]
MSTLLSRDGSAHCPGRPVLACAGRSAAALSALSLPRGGRLIEQPALAGQRRGGGGGVLRPHGARNGDCVKQTEDA